MARFKLFFLLIVMFQIFFVLSETNYCPEQCICDLYKNLNRAQCSAQKLINAAIDVPKIVEILDLSNNAITTLDNNCFEGFRNLLNLSIYSNYIHTIYLDAFAELEKVQFIDLSFNRLEYFDPRIFELNKKLTSLNLAGNKFMSLQNKAFLTSKTLQHLSLRNSQITHIYPLLFDEVPSLSKLDISENLLITLTSRPFNTLNKLKFINLFGNRWICDKNIEITVKNLKKRNVEVRFDTCKFEIKPKGAMFERMMVLPQASTARAPTNINDIWEKIVFVNETTCLLADSTKICQLYKACLANYSQLLEQSGFVTFRKEELQNARINKTFYVGLVFGYLLGFIPLICVFCCYYCCCKRKKIKSRRTHHTLLTNAGRTTNRRYPAPDTVPTRDGSVSTDAGGTLHRSQRTNNRSDFAAFIARLFERPRRHHYYRNINQNTADIIRRISRSSIYVGSRLSQHFGENRNPAPDTERLIEHTAPNNDNLISQSNLTDRRENINLNLSEQVRMFRPETPPPSYRDVIYSH